MKMATNTPVVLTMSDSLADYSTNKMTAAPRPRNAAWMKAYMETLINPLALH
jgi:hypothetical protein